MQNTRTYIAVMAIAASASLLAACSNEDDATPPMESAPPATAPGSTAPAPLSPEPPATSPGASTTPSSGEPSIMDQLKADADDAGDAISEKATELKDDAAAAAERARQAVADGAAKADKAILEELGSGNGSAAGTTPPATTN